MIKEFNFLSKNIFLGFSNEKEGNVKYDFYNKGKDILKYVYEKSH